ncbi:ComF family protein [Roseimicrobium gellanilyticum]|uniref:ComF family protein n=1 Tax=Roseimicrobium gellanilyticum TaxID=748857 RepID=A0A366HNF7_9BACT|nr:ComF family protein [Roseimicrobium gellanilyticum]RBP43852.1 ComF family protein [Roseimicrobium gellanilyticum]
MVTPSPLAKPTPWWRGYTEAFLDLVYTRKCEGCEVFLPAQRQDEARWLCDVCLKEVQRIHPPFCEVCGESYDGAISGTFRCGNCTGLKLHFDFAIAACQAEGVVRELIHKFKYNRRLHLRGVLGHLLGRTMEDSRLSTLPPAEWALVPVPLHHARQRERDYNQSMELCRELSRTFGIPVVDALRRVRSTTAQASLSRHQRFENLRGAFQASPSLVRQSTLKNRSVLLVDDVLTTGSTTSECARVLRREAGVQKVVVITVARG